MLEKIKILNQHLLNILPDTGHLHHHQVGEGGAVPLHAVVEDNLDQVKVRVKVEVDGACSGPVFPGLHQHGGSSFVKGFEAKNYEAPETFEQELQFEYFNLDIVNFSFLSILEVGEKQCT